MSNQNTEETDDVVVDNVEEGIANVTNNNQPPVPSAPRLSDFDLSSYQSRRSTNNTLELNNTDDNDNSDMPLPMGMAEEISNRAEPPKQTGKVEQIDDDDNGPEPPTAVLETSLNAAEKSNDMIRSSLATVNSNDGYNLPTPFNSTNCEDTIAKKKVKDELNQTTTNEDEVVMPLVEESVYIPTSGHIESLDGIANSEEGSINRIMEIESRDAQDIESQTRTDNND